MDAAPKVQAQADLGEGQEEVAAGRTDTDSDDQAPEAPFGHEGRSIQESGSAPPSCRPEGQEDQFCSGAGSEARAATAVRRALTTELPSLR